MLLTRWLFIPVLLCLFLAAPVGAQAPGTPIDRISTLRVELARLDEGRRRVQRQRDELARQVEALAQAIEGRKLQGPGGLLPDFRLQADLQKSQEMAELLTQLNRELASLEGVRRAQLERLDGLYAAAVTEALGELRALQGLRRADLAPLIARLRAEQTALQAELGRGSASLTGSAGDSAMSQLASDDPDELRERADAVRDEQDRLRRELGELDRRLASLERNLGLEREVRDFLTDQELFGEQARVLRLPRVAAGKSDENSFDRNQGGGPGGEVDGSPDGSLGFGPPEPGAPDGASAGNSRLPMGVDGSGAGPAGGERQGAAGLRSRRSALIERIKQLQVLHDRLRDKVEELSRE